MSPVAILGCAVGAVLGGWVLHVSIPLVFTVCVCSITAWNYFTGKV